MTKIKLKLVVAGFIQNEKGEFLIADRPVGSPLAGFWEFPGGKVEPGEMPEHALVRELKEELGMDLLAKDVEPLTFISHRYENFDMALLLYKIIPLDCTPQPQEGQNIAWISWDQIKDYRFHSANGDLLRQACETLKNK